MRDATFTQFLALLLGVFIAGAAVHHYLWHRPLIDRNRHLEQRNRDLVARCRQLEDNRTIRARANHPTSRPRPAAPRRDLRIVPREESA